MFAKIGKTCIGFLRRPDRSLRISLVRKHPKTLSNFYSLMILGVIGFQIARILGAPWGRLTQGGHTECPSARSGRIVAAVSIAMLVGMALAILSADGRWPGWPSWTGWAAVAVNALSMVLE